MAATSSWSWADEHNTWSSYRPDICTQLDAAFAQPGTKQVGISIGHGGSSAASQTHVIDLEGMEQVNARTGFRRPVRCQAKGSGSGSMSFQNEKGKWIGYAPEVSSQVCLAALAGRPGTTVYVPQHDSLWAYWVDLKRMQQINTRTHMARPVRFDKSPSSTSSSRPSGSSAAAGTAAGPALPWQLSFTATSPADRDLGAVLGWKVLQPGEYPADGVDPIMQTDLGEDGEAVVRLPCDSAAVPCTFNCSTVEAAFQSSNKCPTCGTLYGLPGAQPTGSMHARLLPDRDCDGHAGVGTILVQYSFPDGTQLPQHPQPGLPYSGTHRNVVLPNDEMGRECLRLLRAAFAQGELFRVGRSSTLGRDNTVVWAIHQKTSHEGGPTRHGWPDPEYLQRLQSECAAANVKGALDLPTLT